MKYGFIKEQAEHYSVQLLCEIMSVSTSGYYEWRQGKVSARTQSNNFLDGKISEVFMLHKQRYGSPRMTKELNGLGLKCSHTRVERRMQVLGLQAKHKRKFKVTTDSAHNQPVYDNVLNRDFSTTALNQKWASDITYIPTDEGWLYLAVIIDLHSRAVVGWAMSSCMKKDLVCDALMMALFRRKFPAGVIVHSDRGSQYASKRYRRIMKANKLIGSMSRRGNCWDNSIAESFFHSLKVELVHSTRYRTREIAKTSLFEYIEGYYNRIRLHSALGYTAPAKIEAVV